MVKWKYEDGKKILTKKPQLCLELMIFEKSEEFSALCAGIDLCLPAADFEKMDEGDIIRLKYNDELVELTINQLYVSRQLRGRSSGPREPLDRKSMALLQFLKVQSITDCWP